MSRITDLIDGAGGAGTAALAPAPRAVVATQDTGADAVWQALATGASLPVAAGAGGASGVTSVFVAGSSVEGAEPGGPAGSLEGSYHAHPLFVPDLPAGRVLVHALRLLEEDSLSDLDEATRERACSAATSFALAAEATGTPLTERLTRAAVDAYLATTPAAWSNAAQLPPASALAAPEALLVLDAVLGGVAATRGGLPLVLVRAGRPALLAVAAGEHSSSALVLVKLLVATLDLGQPLAATLSRLSPGGEALATMLDERGAFQAASSAGVPIHVRGYERDEAS